MTIRPPLEDPIANAVGQVTQSWRRWFQNMSGAGNTANGAASAGSVPPNSRRINAGPGLRGGGDLAADMTISLYRAVDLVANLPATSALGDHAYATDACNSGEGSGSGTGCEVVWSGLAWRIPGQSGAVSA